MEHVRLGFIGSGNIATKHLNVLRAYPQASVVALCDLDINTAKRTSVEHTDGQALVYDEYQKMLDNHELDAVYLCIPPAAHGPIERTLCERGIHMFIEKPIHLHLEDAIIVEEYVKKHNIITCVGYHWRYNAPNQHARRLVANNKHVLGAVGAWVGSAPDTPWWYNEHVSGGQHHEQTTHLFDTIRYFLGAQNVEGTEVQGFCQHGWVKLDKELHFITVMSVVNIRFGTGRIATITSCCQSETDRVQIEVFCDGLTVKVGSDGNTYCQGSSIPEPLDTHTTRNIDDVFLDAVMSKNTKHIMSDYSDALNTLRLTCAVKKSFANHNGGSVFV